jgi:LysM repeat protein
LYFIHSRYLEGRFPTGAAKTLEKAKVAIVSAQRVKPRENLPQLSQGEKSYVVRAGDNYTRIAAVENVDEDKLRLVNNHVDIGPGLALKMPPKRIVAVDPPEVTAQREPSGADHSNRGLVEATPVNVVGAPKARPVRLLGGREVSRSVTVGKAGAGASRASGAPKVSGRAPVVAVVGGGKSHVVKSGESISRIAKRFKVSQVELMRLNHINDARKMKIGTKLVIPKS